MATWALAQGVWGERCWSATYSLEVKRMNIARVSTYPFINFLYSFTLFQTDSSEEKGLQTEHGKEKGDILRQ